MPLYEYACRACSNRFEQLLFGREKPACPRCRGTDLEKLLSTFAVGAAGAASFGGSGGSGGPGTEGAGGGGGGCGSCGDPRGPGSCAID